tara:strand:- start:935 stop:2995 length:2061 start_codon:yes stop_codon:yes gene_type:complete
MRKLSEIIKIYIIYLIIFFFSSNAFSQNINHSVEDVDLAHEIVSLLEKNHFTKKRYNEIYVKASEIYLERLDPTRSFLLDHEVLDKVQEDTKYDLLDSQISVSFNLFKIYQKRYKQRSDLHLALLKEIETLNLNQDIKILLDRSEAPWMKSEEELTTLWRNQFINSVIQLLINGNTNEEVITKLTKQINCQRNDFLQTRNEDVFGLFINSIASSYDPHTSYFSPRRTEDFEIEMSLSLEGIGALLTSDCIYTSISSLVPGGPAEKSKTIQAEDRIVAVGQEKDIELTDVIGWRIDDVVNLIRGPKGTKVKLEIIPASSPDNETEIIEITRGNVKLEDQDAEKRIINVNKNGKSLSLGVIKLPAFYMDFEAYNRGVYDYKSSSKDVKNLIKELKRESVDGLILDLRNNGGGSLLEANALAHLFLGGGTKVQVKSSNGRIDRIGRIRGFQTYDDPLIILVNRASASASEILAGAIQDYKRGLILGTETFGKGTVQRLETVSKGQLKFTESKFYRVSGGSTQSKGIQPNLILPSLIDSEEVGEGLLPQALKYDQISSTRYKNFNRLGSSLPLLKKMSDKRIRNSLLFDHYEKLMLLREERKNQKWLSINLEERKAKKEEYENIILTMENELRKKLGLNTFRTYSDYLDREEDIKQLDLQEEVLNEAANVMADFIYYSFNPAIILTKEAS